MKIAYLRVSTDEQRPDRQIDGLKAISDELHVEMLSAVSKRRPVFDAVTAKLEPGDTFLVWDLDRAFRSTVDALLVADNLRDRGVHFQIATMNIDTSTEFGELLYTVVAAFARFERRILSRRTKEGMAAARRRGQRLGRQPKLTTIEVVSAHRRLVSKASTISSLARELGCARDTLTSAFKRLGLEY